MYYTGSCDDATVLEKIKSNFINEIGKLILCEGKKNNCTVEFVLVTCGPRTRTRRSLEHNVRSTRSDSEIRVEINIFVTWPFSNVSTSDSFNIAKKLVQTIFHQIKNISKEGKLTVEGISPDDESFVLGYARPVCDDGLYLRQNTISCGK